MYHVDETHVVLTNLGLLETLGIIPARRAGISDRPRRLRRRQRRRRARRAAGTRCSIPARRGRTSDGRRRDSPRVASALARRARAAVGRPLGTGRGGAGRARSSRRPSGAAILSPPTTIADLVALSRGRRAVRVRRHRARAHRRRRRHADRRHLRSDAPVAQRSVVAGRRDGVARRRCVSAITSAQCRLEDDVSRGHSGGRGASRRSSAGWPERRVPEIGAGVPVQAVGCSSRASASRSGSPAASPCSGWRRRRGRRLPRDLPVALAGEAIRFWAAGHLNKSREVTRSGPYRFVAHPLYLGSSVIGAGLAIASHSVVGRGDRRRVPGDHADGGHQERGSVPAADVRRRVRRVHAHGRRRSRAAGSAWRARWRIGSIAPSRALRSALLLLVWKATYNGTF